MRTRMPPAAFVFAAIASLLLSADGGQVASASAEVEIELVDRDAPEAAAIRRTGETAINWLGAKFAYEINRALQRKDPAAILAVSHLKAVSSPREALPGMPSVAAFKATSLRVINPANVPDTAEQVVLEHVQRKVDRGEPPRDLIVQKIRQPNGATEWRVYRPLVVLPTCVACHGDTATQDPALRDLLRQQFPDTTATGYAVGEWRGLLRVSITPPSTGPES